MRELDANGEEIIVVWFSLDYFNVRQHQWRSQGWRRSRAPSPKSVFVQTNFTPILCDKTSEKDVYDTGKTPFHPLRIKKRSASGPAGKAHSTPPYPLLSSGEGMGRRAGA